MIIVKVSELKSMVKELEKDGYDYVEVSILDNKDEDDLPNCLCFSALDGYGGAVDFDDIEESNVGFSYKAEEEYERKLKKQEERMVIDLNPNKKK
ncbi:MAG TPA: hypothetical protein DCP90_01925 [Clostridiales bacterium]|nr:MAG: hypothetical protein A2Y22_08730 [Clostridiales bacterium GWD2_32_59]HAN09351.1 hypothetical protein [Clostridiales bacterium]